MLNWCETVEALDMFTIDVIMMKNLSLFHHREYCCGVDGQTVSMPLADNLTTCQRGKCRLENITSQDGRKGIFIP